jgi:hypothetical protein
VSVLLGHTHIITLLDFCPHPSAPAALLSSSYDGTVRLWDALDGAARPAVLPIKAFAAAAAAAAAAGGGMARPGGAAGAPAAAASTPAAAALQRQRQAQAQAQERLEGLTHRQRALLAASAASAGASGASGGAGAAAAAGPAPAGGGGQQQRVEGGVSEVPGSDDEGQVSGWGATTASGCCWLSQE